MKSIFSLLGMILLSCGCASAGAPFETPSGTVDYMIRSALNRDGETFRSAFIEKSRDFLEKNQTCWQIVWAQAQTYKSDFEIDDETISGGTAVVVISFPSAYSGIRNKDKLNLIKETAGKKSGWKINIDFQENFKKEKEKQEAEGLAGCVILNESARKYFETTEKYPSGLEAMIRTGFLDARFASGNFGAYHYIYKKGEEGESFKLWAEPLSNSLAQLYYFLDVDGAMHGAIGRSAASDDLEVQDWKKPFSKKRDKSLEKQDRRP